MANAHRISTVMYKTFEQYTNAYFAQIDNLCLNANSIHFVFDTYLNRSVKDSERIRRSTTPAVEISNINQETLLPLEFDSFWDSNENKKKLQMLLHKTILSDNIMLSAEGIDEETQIPCTSKHGEEMSLTMTLKKLMLGLSLTFFMP